MISEKIKKRTDNDLLDMIKNHTQFQDDFIVAAYKELKNREIEFDEIEIKNVIDKIEQQKEETVKKIQKRKKIIRDIHPNIKKSVKFIIAAIVIKFLQIFFVTSGITVEKAGFSLHFSDIFNLVILGLIAFVIRNGEIWVRYLCLFGFAIGILLDFGLIGLLISEEIYLIAILVFFGIVIKLIVLFYLFNRKTNKWYKEIKPILNNDD
jgi:hypothetical protein